MQSVRPLALLVLLAAPLLPAGAAPRTVDLEILGTTDLHGHIYPTSYFNGNAEEALGLAKIATLVKRERATHKNVLLVDSGDVLQGSPLTDWFVHHGDPLHRINPMIATMNLLGYSACSVGNHDFDYGLPLLYKARRDANFPFLSANAFQHGTRIPEFKPYVIVTIAGIRVGILGSTPPGVALWDKAQVQGQLDFGGEVQAFERYVPEMKAHGADIIVGAPHAGYGGDGPFGPTYDGYSEDSGLPPEQVGFMLARQVKDLDVLMLGHSHHGVWSEPGSHRTQVLGAMDGSVVRDIVPRPIAIAQADKWGSHLAMVRLTLQRQGGRWTIVRRVAATVSTKGVAPDPAILALDRKVQQATLAYVQTPVTATPTAWVGRLARVEDTPIVDLINTVQLAQTHAQLSAAADFDPSAGLARGPVSIAEVAALYPYENLLVAVRITGKQLEDYLEWMARYYAPFEPGAAIFNRAVPGFDYDMIAGVNYAIDVRRPVGQRIVGLEYHGRPVSPGQTFTLALNSYRQRGGGGFGAFNRDSVVYDRGENIRDVLISYLHHRKSIAPSDVFMHDNWHLLPAGAVDPATLRYVRVP